MIPITGGFHIALSMPMEPKMTAIERSYGSLVRSVNGEEAAFAFVAR